MKEDTKWFIGFILFLFLMWFVGGTETTQKRQSPKPTPYSYDDAILGAVTEGPSTKSIEEQIEDVEREARKIQEELSQIELNKSKSEYSGLVTLSRAGATNKDPDKEYLEIRILNNIENDFALTGWTVRSPVTGISFQLGKGTSLPILGKITNKETIIVSPGSRIIVTTGRSPIGASFKTNICTGYLEQFQDFRPSLRRECPRPIDELPGGGAPGTYKDSCIDFVESMSRCYINTNPLPLWMDNVCQEFIVHDINYNACVDKHKNEENFYKNEWRIYLSRDTEIWKSKREIIELLDNEGKLVDVVNY